MAKGEKHDAIFQVVMTRRIDNNTSFATGSANDKRVMTHRERETKQVRWNESKQGLYYTPFQTKNKL